MIRQNELGKLGFMSSQPINMMWCFFQLLLSGKNSSWVLNLTILQNSLTKLLWKQWAMIKHKHLTHGFLNVTVNAKIQLSTVIDLVIIFHLPRV